jgi:hypothetical protein
MDNDKNWKKLILDRVETLLISLVFITIVFLIDVRITVPIMMVVSIFLVNVKWAVRGAFLGTTFGLLITLIFGGIAQEWILIVTIAPYSVIFGAIMGFYIGGLAGAFFRQPSNKFVAKAFAKWRQENQGNQNGSS